jgi:hypothetical protein
MVCKKNYMHENSFILFWHGADLTFQYTVCMEKYFHIPGYRAFFHLVFRKEQNCFATGSVFVLRQKGWGEATSEMDLTEKLFPVTA